MLWRGEQYSETHKSAARTLVISYGLSRYVYKACHPHTDVRLKTMCYVRGISNEDYVCYIRSISNDEYVLYMQYI